MTIGSKKMAMTHAMHGKQRAAHGCDMNVSYSTTMMKLSIAYFNIFPQQPERLGVLPIKLRGGLGQPPETLHQVPRGSEGMEPVPK